MRRLFFSTCRPEALEGASSQDFEEAPPAEMAHSRPTRTDRPPPRRFVATAKSWWPSSGGLSKDNGGTWRVMRGISMDFQMSLFHAGRGKSDPLGDDGKKTRILRRTQGRGTLKLGKVVATFGCPAAGPWRALS